MSHRTALTSKERPNDDAAVFRWMDDVESVPPAFCPAGDGEPGTVERAGRRIRSGNDLVAEGPLPATSGRCLVSACVDSETWDSTLACRRADSGRGGSAGGLEEEGISSSCKEVRYSHISIV